MFGKKKKEKLYSMMPGGPEIYTKEERDRMIAERTTRTTAGYPDYEAPRCPSCGSTYLTADRKGFSATKGAIGTFLFDDILAGAIIGSRGSNKVIVTCMKCGHQWKIGK